MPGGYGRLPAIKRNLDILFAYPEAVHPEFTRAAVALKSARDIMRFGSAKKDLLRGIRVICGKEKLISVHNSLNLMQIAPCMSFFQPMTPIRSRFSYP